MSANLYEDLSSYCNYEQGRIEPSGDSFAVTTIASHRDIAALVKRRRITTTWIDAAGKGGEQGDGLKDLDGTIVNWIGLLFYDFSL